MTEIHPIHSTKAYEEGYSGLFKNPYDFWNEYEKHYAFCLGEQKYKMEICQSG